jgi:3-methyl-2-oxobutanoate hydroxymethyltransferase
MKAEQKKFACLTAYDFTLARCISSAGVEVMLVGDSLGMVIQGHDSTLPVTLEDMAYHTRCVKRGNLGSLLMVDMPALYYANPSMACESSRILVQAGAEVIKLEGEAWMAPVVSALSDNGIPVCAHLGLTPQSVHKFGGFKVQARESAAADKLLRDAECLVDAGAAMVLVECIPAPLARTLREACPVPVIGIGAGPDTDGQILVAQDMLGMNRGHVPRFVKNFMAEADSIAAAIETYATDVRTGRFPTDRHSFGGKA